MAQAQFWANANGCADDPAQQERGMVIVRQYRCPAGSAVEIHLLRDNGHAWPGGQAGSRMGDTPSAALNATDVIWNFFKTQTR